MPSSTLQQPARWRRRGRSDSPGRRSGDPGGMLGDPSQAGRLPDRRSCHHHGRQPALTPAHGIATIAFPSISTGIYGFPIERASGIALRTAARYVSAHHHLTEGVRTSLLIRKPSVSTWTPDQNAHLEGVGVFDSTRNAPKGAIDPCRWRILPSRDDSACPPSRGTRSAAETTLRMSPS